LLVLACLPVTIQAQSAAPGYRIAGTVVNAQTGEPVRGATVSVLALEDSHSIASTQTGSDGHFSVDGLPAAKYQLTASKRGYSTAAYDEHGDFSSAIVTGDDPNSNFDTTHLVFRLTPGTALRGVVTADGGDPVADAEVMLFKKPQGYAPGERIVQQETAITDDIGTYEFSNLSPGEYLLAAKATPWYAMHGNPPSPGQTSATPPNSALDVAYPITYFDSTTDEASASPILLAQGSRIDANLTLHAVSAIRLQISAPRRQDGQLARPQLRQTIFGETVNNVSAGFLDAATTGSTEFVGVPPGQYELTQGDPPRVVELDATASLQVEPGAGLPAFPVAGTLETADGKPVTSFAMVTLEPADAAQGLKPLESSFNKGAFSFPAVPVGAWKLSAQVDGLPESVLSIVAAGQAHSGSAVTVHDHPLTLVARVTSGGPSVEGFARKDGKGVSGVMVLLVPRALSTLPDPSMLDRIRRDQSDSDGSFSLHDAAPGQYSVLAIQDGWDLDWTRPGILARYLPAGIPVTVKATSENAVRLAEPVPVQSR
jgi:5-hydroxyisourate hydrolase-like protein (transthyretin family)